MGMFYGVECKADIDKDALLVVVDMQGGFETSNRDQDVVDNVKKLIEKSIKKNKKIIFLEYEDQGLTLDCLTELCSNYPHKFFVTKYENDGSQSILEFLKEKKIDKDHLKKISVCGVNTAFCVKSTVEGLRNLSDSSLKIIVEGDACNSMDFTLDEQEIAFAQMSQLENVKVKNPHGALLIKSLQKKYPLADLNIIKEVMAKKLDIDAALGFISENPQVSVQDILGLRKEYVDLEIARQFKQLFPETTLADLIKIQQSDLWLEEALKFKKDFPKTTLKFIFNLTSQSDYDISYFREHPALIPNFSK
jgi:nicotinamidase-related amidase